MEPADEAPRAYIPFLPAVKSGQPRFVCAATTAVHKAEQRQEAIIPCVQRY